MLFRFMPSQPRIYIRLVNRKMLAPTSQSPNVPMIRNGFETMKSDSLLLQHLRLNITFTLGSGMFSVSNLMPAGLVWPLGNFIS